MRKNKKPAIASEWRENKAAQDRAEQQAERERARVNRSRRVALVGAFFKHLLASAGWVVAIVLAVLLATALATYTAADPGFSATGTVGARNLCGLIGAWVSDFLYWLLGRSSWWIVAALLATGVSLVRVIWARGDSIMLRIRPVSATFGMVLLLTASSGLECLQFGYVGEELPLGAGGLYGQYVAGWVTPYLGIWGSSFVAFVCVAVGASFVFGFSWFDVAERIGTVLESIGALISFKRPVKKGKEAKSSKEVSDAAAPEVAAALPEVEAAPEAKGRQLKTRAINVELPQSTPTPSNRDIAARQPELFPKANDGSILPSISMLQAPATNRAGISEETVRVTSRLIESKLKAYRINATVVGAQAGPVITQYWLEPGPGVKGSQIEDIRKDLSRALAVPSVRVVPVIPGKPYMGLEIPNGSSQRLSVYLREIIGSVDFESSKSSLSLALGKDIAGKPVVIDLAKLPHLLVGGTTGSGKSVCINTMILSLLYKNEPERLRLVLIDPKTVEFSLYQDIPHLLCPVVTDMNKASNALNWLVTEMERRYHLMAKLGVRSYDSFNKTVEEAIKNGKPFMVPFDVTPENPEPHTPLKPFSYIVCFIDELADLMLVNRKQVETQIMRLAQKARAAGIHLVLATQRPSADIVTPLIKANIVARIAFQVGSRYDSQVVLDETGAQDLLGRGDMLFKRPGASPQRVQGCMVEEDEVLRVVAELKSMGAPEYVEGVTDSEEEGGQGASGGFGLSRSNDVDPLYDQAAKIVIEEKRASTSYVQRRLGIGYNRAANLLERMEADGLVSKPNAAGKREVLVKHEGGVL